MNNDKQVWKEHAAQLKRKRAKNQGGKKQDDNENAKKNCAGNKIIQEQEMIVQQLFSDVVGTAKRYHKVGAQEFVAYPYSELSIENLSAACAAHFKDILGDDQRCDILRSQNGPSCSKLSQIKTWEVIFVRFVTDPSLVSTSVTKYFPRMPRRNPLSSVESNNQSSINTSTSSTVSSATPSKKLKLPSSNTLTVSTVKEYPKSISISTMMKLGTAISCTANPPITVDIQELDVAEM